MLGIKSRTAGESGACYTIEYVCACTPFWECVLDEYDYDYNSITVKDRLREWNEKRIETKKLQKLQKKQSRTSSWKVIL